MRRLIVFMFLALILSGTVQAIETYEYESTVNLQYICTLDGAIPINANLNISLYNPGGQLVLNNVGTTAQGQGSFNYTFQFINTGVYKVKIFCYDSLNHSYATEDYYNIIGVGNTENKGLNETVIYIFITIILCMGLYKYVNKFLGSFFIFIMGVATLFTVRANGWIGYIIMAIGFIALIDATFSEKKRRYR